MEKIKIIKKIIFLKKRILVVPTVAQRVKDLELSLQQLGSLLWHRFDPSEVG